MRVIVAGGGQAGALIARRLSREGNEVTIVEPNAERCQELEDLLDVKVVNGNAARVRAMRAAGVAKAEMMIAVSNYDEINVLACLIAHAEGHPRTTVARIRTHEVDEWRRLLDKNGPRVDLIIHPETDVAERVMRVVRLPGVSDIVDFAEGRVKLFGMNVDHDSWLVGRTLEELQEAKPPKDSLIPMIFRGQQLIIPHGAQLLKEGDHVYTLATDQNLHEVMEFMGLDKPQPLKRVFIVGGRQIGITLAEQLEEQGVSVKLFEKDTRRCEKIAGILEKSVVIHGDGSDQATLQEENVEGAGAFLALTADDEVNIIASMLARRLGVPKVVALINRLSYLPMAQRLGVNTTVSPRLSTVDRVLQFVRKGKVLSVTTFREEEAEAIELVASAGRKYVGRKLKEIRFPRGAIVGAIVRPDGQVQIPRGEATIEHDDRVIFFTRESVVHELETAFLEKSKRGGG
jgi:trk system potassium uptake protein TrkA